MFARLLVLILLTALPLSEDSLMVGKWKLKRKIPQEGPNRCFVDQVTFYEDNAFELIFKTIIDNEVVVYTYDGKINKEGNGNINLGDGVATLKDFSSVEDKIDFRFEYGDKLGMFCTRENHPYPHKHLPHDLEGKQISKD